MSRAELKRDRKPRRRPPAAKETRELSLDSGTMANKRSIAGGGHAVRFKVDGDSNYVTSVSLHGSRYGMPQPPREDFHVWICDSKFKPIATFRFRYGAYTRGNPVWKSFKVKPTAVPEEFIVCFGFNPQATKGVYVSYDNKPSQTSMVGDSRPRRARVLHRRQLDDSLQGRETRRQRNIRTQQTDC